MKRGEIWTVSGGSDYTGKPRPAVIVQSDQFELTASVTLCPLTTWLQLSPLARPLVTPDATNGLLQPSRVMVDKISTVSRHRVGSPIGHLADEDIANVDHALAEFLKL